MHLREEAGAKILTLTLKAGVEKVLDSLGVTIHRTRYPRSSCDTHKRAAQPQHVPNKGADDRDNFPMSVFTPWPIQLNDCFPEAY